MRRSFASEGAATLQIRVARTQAVLASRAQVAHSLIDRMVGLLRRKTLSEGEALLIPSCRSIHTYGMRFSIDAVFVDRQWRVVALQERLEPWRMSPIAWRAHGVLELPPGTIQQAHLELGDRLVVHAV